MPPYPNTYGNIRICLFEDDGQDGLPGTLIDKLWKYIYSSNKNWNEFDNIFSHKLDSGSFYIGIETQAPTSPSVVSDTSGICHYTSYKKIWNDWMLDSTCNYMIRPRIEEYGGLSPNIIGFEAALVTEVEPCIYPDSTVLSPISGFSHYFPNGQPEYYFSAATRAHYNLSTSEWTYSNIIPPKGSTVVEFNITSCNQGSVDSTYIKLRGTKCGYTDYNTFTDNNGYAKIDTVLSDNYRIVATHYGNNSFADTVEITVDTTINIVLLENIYPPYNVQVDSTTNILSWKRPVVGPIQLETFEGEEFPP